MFHGVHKTNKKINQKQSKLKWMCVCGAQNVLSGSKLTTLIAREN